MVFWVALRLTHLKLRRHRRAGRMHVFRMTLVYNIARAMMAAGALSAAGCNAITAPYIAPTTVIIPISPANNVEPLRPASAPTPQKLSRRATASRYGSGLAGNVTSNGERYNPNSLTAASTSLPMGSTAKVTNLQNGKTVFVRINDRGPYVRGRSLDLSGRAADAIGLTDKGVAKVKITPLQSSTDASALPAPSD